MAPQDRSAIVCLQTINQDPFTRSGMGGSTTRNDDMRKYDMNIHRKIQLAAAAVIANGALALSFLSPSPAFAASCNIEKIFCAPATLCESNSFRQEICTTYAPPGCKILNTECGYPIIGNCLNAGYPVFCNYH
jgi:hypothetical protein